MAMAFVERTPLAARLRPKTLNEIVGQEKLLGQGAPLRMLIESGKLSSIILWGPAGTGKTTIARVIAIQGKMKFVALSATSAGVKEIRKEGEEAIERQDSSLMFIDEAHRLSSTQSDVLLPYVESGVIIWIGATTSNPYHAISSALLSRSQIFGLEPLSKKDLFKVLLRGVEYYRGKGRDLEIDKEAADRIAVLSCGDARKILSILELCVELSPEAKLLQGCQITKDLVDRAVPSKFMPLTDSAHFDYASWMQGAIQASDPDAAVFALAKWLESGEDPRYIARRIVVSASEDACSTPAAAMAANNAFIAACEIGRPECDLVLSHAVVMIASAKRDKSAAIAIWTALKDVRENLDVEVPKEMKDCHYASCRELGFGSYRDGANPSAYVGVSKTYYCPWR